METIQQMFPAHFYLVVEMHRQKQIPEQYRLDGIIIILIIKLKKKQIN